MCYACTQCGRCGKFGEGGNLASLIDIVCLRCGGRVDPQTGVCEDCGALAFAPAGTGRTITKGNKTGPGA